MKIKIKIEIMIIIKIKKQKKWNTNQNKLKMLMKDEMNQNRIEWSKFEIIVQRIWISYDRINMRSTMSAVAEERKTDTLVKIRHYDNRTIIKHQK